VGWKARAKYLIAGAWAFRRDFFQVIGLGLLVTFLYIRSDWTVEPTFVTWAQTLPAGKLHDTMLWISQHLKIFTNAGEGLAQQIKHNMRGHASYIFGQEHKRAIWYYFPAAMTIKCSVLFLLLPIMIAVARGRSLWTWPSLCALVLFVYSVTCRVQLGIRFMFPLMALAAVGYGAAVVIAWREGGSGWKRFAPAAVVSAGLIWNLVACLRVWPEGICYTNELWGGTENGYTLLSDSNYDWGQGLKELLKWREAHSVDVVHVWYFGLDPRADVQPLKKLPLHEDQYGANGALQQALRGKCVAVSTTMLYGPYLANSPAGRAAVAFFKTCQPAGRTLTYFIYDFR
jgi:hypothetical protein